jgi:hypothetical protein
MRMCAQVLRLHRRVQRVLGWQEACERGIVSFAQGEVGYAQWHGLEDVEMTSYPVSWRCG